MKNELKTQETVILQLEKKGFRVINNFKDFDQFIYILAKEFKGTKTTLYAQVDEKGEVNGMSIDKFLSNLN